VLLPSAVVLSMIREGLRRRSATSGCEAWVTTDGAERHGDFAVIH
jgi:hypothetical protein